jgi:fucose permease
MTVFAKAWTAIKGWFTKSNEQAFLAKLYAGASALQTVETAATPFAPLLGPEAAADLAIATGGTAAFKAAIQIVENYLAQQK